MDSSQAGFFSRIYQKFSKIHSNIWILSIVSLCAHFSAISLTAMGTDVLTTVFNKDLKIVGRARGIADSASYVFKFLSGIMSDGVGVRKIFVVIGEIVGILTKPLLIVSLVYQNLFMYISLHVIEKIASGLRDSPRDAMIADCTVPSDRSLAYGIRNFGASFGCVIGTAVCIVCLITKKGEIFSAVKMILTISIIPAIIAAIIALFKLGDVYRINNSSNTSSNNSSSSRTKVMIGEIINLDRRFFLLVAAVFFFMCGKFSDSFITSRARIIQMDSIWNPILILIYSLTNSIVTMFFGVKAIDTNRWKFIVAGAVSFTAAAYLITHANNRLMLIIGSVLYGAHYGFYYCNFNGLIADFATENTRATCFGIFNLICACGIYMANELSGQFWSRGLYSYCFYFSAAAMSISILLISYLGKTRFNRLVADNNAK